METPPQALLSQKEKTIQKLFNLTNKKNIFTQLTDLLWQANPEIRKIIHASKNIEKIRQNLFKHFQNTELELLSLSETIPPNNQNITFEALKAFKNIISPKYENITKHSTLNTLLILAHQKKISANSDINLDFLIEMIYLLKSVSGQADIYHTASENLFQFLHTNGRKAAEIRTRILDELTKQVSIHFQKYPSGLEKNIPQIREKNKKRILAYFKGTEKDWHSYKWQIKNVIKDLKPINELINLHENEKEAIRLAALHHIPFGITPYYLSLMDQNHNQNYDQAIRAQVIPPLPYIKQMIKCKNRNSVCDFMEEYSTSPIDLITRRYPFIAIFKPFNTCAQICVYCQRNWEIQEVLDPHALASKEKIQQALNWFDEHPEIGDILITGGDPMIMTDQTLKFILDNLAQKPHVYRIRIGTRTPVVLPMRWTDKCLKMLASYHVPGQREIAIVTHFEHSAEISPASMSCIQKIRQKNLSVYNQQVFTPYNSRKFETAKLRRDLRLIGVDPYYTFNPKGKEETEDYRVPIARILQERKEEARLFPGLDRTDEPVFNVPRLGKNHLRAGQDHRLIMISPNGRRIYEFDPWEKNIQPVPSYHYTDISILDYLTKLSQRKENPQDYHTIWYYY
ncbi:KamA family radical SAM protein [bacterium]|jgi:lysine 2,3-aminomutase|nr:KamA family radical SAM protein [bacterium]MBT3581428.1 KamA family radical SAM protein [bacterium]MBT4552532.1 KamA family radical SAM protein [bacterium]MBT5988675.1 KamA family radical SAM protein [bacterium]MBT7088129.1 KamA family radical SAM protein [bacterium]